MIRFDAGFEMTIDGRAWTAPVTLPVANPATGASVGEAPMATQDDLDAAVNAARHAFPGWRAIPIEERRRRLAAMAEAVDADREAFARLLTCEQGKPIAEARLEVARSAEWLRATATLALPSQRFTSATRRIIECERVPVGVVGAIAPWNFPLSLAVWKVAPALLAGNCMVLKPSPFTPLTTLKFGEAARALLPPGVLNVVAGDDRLGPWMTAHAGIDKIAFTGSTATGKAILRSAAAHLKRVTLELGGNDAAIVLPDIDIESAVPRLFWAAFRNNAQLCIAAKRLFVHADIYDRFARAFVDYARKVRVGDGLDPATQIGPVQNAAQLDRLRALLANAHARGVRFLLGGNVPAGPGNFMPIAIADDPPDDSPIVAEEAFGPVLPLLRYASIEEAVARANATPYALGASVGSGDIAQARAVAARLEAGTVWINTAGETFPDVPFAGHRQSGFGVENGTEGLLEYTLPRSFVIDDGVAA